MLIMVGCGNGETGTTTPTTQTNPDNVGVIELEYWHAMGGSRGEATEALVNTFNETVGKEKGINVTAVYQGNEIVSKIKMASQESSGENMPDISQTVGHDIPVTLQIPNMVFAEELINSDFSTISKDNFPESMTRAFTYENKLVGVPMNTSGILLYYNMDMFEAAGLTDPHGLNATVGRYQLVNFVTSQSPESFVGDNEGGRTAPMTKVTIGEDGTLRNFLTEWQKVAVLDGYKFVEDNANEEFVNGISAMTIMSSSRLGTTEELGGGTFNFGVANLPKVNETDTSGASVGGSSLVVYNNGNDAKVEAAWAFVEFATSAETQATWSQASGYMPTNKGSYELESMKTFLAENPKYNVAYQQMIDSSPNSQEPFDLIGSQANTITLEVMEKFCNGSMDIEAAEKEIVDRYNSAIEEYNRANN